MNNIIRLDIGNVNIDSVDIDSVGNRQANDAAHVGGKAQSLIRLYQMGMNVPPGIILDISIFAGLLKKQGLMEKFEDLLEGGSEAINQGVHTYESLSANLTEIIMAIQIPEDIRDAIKEFLEQNKNTSFAVRSSANCEDSEDTSFAGLFHTALNARTLDEVLQGTKACWVSLVDKRVLHYALNKGVAWRDLAMAVIIQRLVNAEKSGVAFSVNPLTGNDKQIVIEACFGLGELLVSGEVTPDQYCFDWQVGHISQSRVADKKFMLSANKEGGVDKSPLIDGSSERVLSSSEIKQLASDVIRIQANYGYPIDVEWAIQEDTFYILQARPITTINCSGIQGEWTTADFKDGGVSSSVCTPYMWSLYDYIWESALPKFLSNIKLRSSSEKPTVWGEMYFGRPYWNLSEVKRSYAKLPGYTERHFDEDVGIEVTYDGSGKQTKWTPKSVINGVKTVFAFRRSLSKHVSCLGNFKREQLKKLDEYASIDIHHQSREERFEWFEKFIRHEYSRSESMYFEHIFHVSVATSLFKDDYRECLKNIPFISLISGLTNVSHLHFNQDIWELSRIIREDKSARNFWATETVETLVACWRSQMQNHNFPQVDHLISRHFYHSTRELDLLVPRYHEDPTFVIQSIKDNIQLDDVRNPQNIMESQFQIFSDSKEKFLDEIAVWKKRKARAALGDLRQLLWWREELRDLSTRFYYYVRKFTLVVAQDLVSMGIIDCIDDIFYLRFEEILDVLNQSASSGEIKTRVKNNRLYYQSFRYFQNPNEIGSRYDTKSTVDSVSLDGMFSSSSISETDSSAFNSHILKGLACSQGIIEGKVKIIRDIFDADRLGFGDILVTPYTDPGWTAKFSLIGGVITETGGVLSHAAVVSREYGIPAVLAVKSATQKIHENDIVRLNGTNGTVEILERCAS